MLDVTRWNELLFSELDAERFFYCVQPYYKPYRVGFSEYRGANASFYSQLLVDKFLYMMPEDQVRLRGCMRRESLLNALLNEMHTSRSENCYRNNAIKFLEVCEVHGRTAEQHHDQFVQKFIEVPAQSLSDNSLRGITASGPPLEVLLRSLKKLRDLRMAAPRDDIPSRNRKLGRLRVSPAQTLIFE